jgi:hypothetical protein
MMMITISREAAEKLLKTNHMSFAAAAAQLILSSFFQSFNFYSLFPVMNAMNA